MNAVIRSANFRGSAAVAVFLPALGSSACANSQASLPTVASSAIPPTPAGACSGRATPAQTEGPYFKVGSPERSSLVEPGMNGTRLTIIGHVFTRACAPVAGALLDFWQADNGGVYDNAGYRLRGHQFTASM